MTDTELSKIRARSECTLVCSAKDIPALLAHIDEQREALTKAESNKAVLVEALGKLMKAYEMILPAVAKISVPDYALLNYAPCQARAVLAKVKGEGSI